MQSFHVILPRVGRRKSVKARLAVRNAAAAEGKFTDRTILKVTRHDGRRTVITPAEYRKLQLQIAHKHTVCFINRHMERVGARAYRLICKMCQILCVVKPFSPVKVCQITLSVQ